MILVCGGAGYIGSHMVYDLIHKGHDVVVIDNLATGYQKSIHPKAMFYNADIRDFEAMDEIFKAHKIDAVIHFAASSLVGESSIEPLKYYDNNVNGTSVLLSVMVKHEVKKIVFSSTAATYGNPGFDIIDESVPTVPINPYGQTKLAVEQMLGWCDKAYGIKSICLRYFNVAGAHESGEIGENHNPETHLIPLALQVPLGLRDEIRIYGNDYNTYDGTCIRDYIYVGDLIEAHYLATKKLISGSDSGIYNLGNGNGFSVLEIIEATRRVTGHGIPSVISSRREGDPDILVASALLAEQKLGWKPRMTSIEDIIRTAWIYYQNKTV